MLEKKKFYITTSIPYLNASLHVGHALEFVQADALARYRRLLGDEVFLLTGTDEHGKKIADAAAREGKTPQEFVDDISAQVKAVLAALAISYDGFVRTSDQKTHIPAVQKIWQQLKAGGDIYKEKYRGKYCIGCEAFLRDAEMRGGNCIIHEKTAEEVEEENYFFRFSKYAKEVERFVREDIILVLPAYRKKEVLNLFSEEGTKDVSVSRPAQNAGWGISVPGDESQIIYVWADALCNYLSGIGYAEGEHKKWWPPEAQVIGKDITRFHVMLWPAMLLALGLDVPRKIYVHGHISSEGKKISKSIGNGIDPLALVKKYGTDAVRYFLLREVPSDDDGDFSFIRLLERYVSDLQNGLGNLISRLTAVAEKHPEVWRGIKMDNTLLKMRAEMLGRYQNAIERFQLHNALAEVWNLVNESNRTIENAKLWEIIRTDPPHARETLKALAENIYAIGILLAPFLPDTAAVVVRSVGAETASFSAASFPVRFQKPSKPLFPRMSLSLN